MHLELHRVFEMIRTTRLAHLTGVHVDFLSLQSVLSLVTHTPVDDTTSLPSLPVHTDNSVKIRSVVTLLFPEFSLNKA